MGTPTSGAQLACGIKASQPAADAAGAGEGLSDCQAECTSLLQPVHPPWVKGRRSGLEGKGRNGPQS